MAKQIYQIQIELKGVKPKIWRRLLVDSDISLDKLQFLIQFSMGWGNSHLHVFSDGMYDYAPKEFEIEDTKNSRSVKLSSVLKKEKSKLIYEYDFGDSWIHHIILEKIIKEEDKGQIPRCIGGKRNCPPEDCGGVWGYEDLLATLADPKHPDHESTMEWLDGEFDPEYFDIDEINDDLG